MLKIFSDRWCHHFRLLKKSVLGVVFIEWNTLEQMQLSETSLAAGRWAQKMVHSGQFSIQLDASLWFFLVHISQIKKQVRGKILWGLVSAHFFINKLSRASLQTGEVGGRKHPPLKITMPTYGINGQYFSKAQKIRGAQSL